MMKKMKMINWIKIMKIQKKNNKMKFFIKTLIIFILIFFNEKNNAFSILSVDIDSGIIKKEKLLVVNLGHSSFEEEYIDHIMTMDINYAEMFDIHNLKERGFNDYSHAVDALEEKIIKDNISFVLIKNTRSDSKDIFVEYKIWNPYSKKIILERKIRLNKSGLRKIGHHISDDLYFILNGVPGFFNTKIFYIHEEAINNKKRKKIASMDYDGYNNRFLTDDRFLILTPRISSDNSKILYVSYQNRIPRVFMLDILKNRHFDILNIGGITSAPRFMNNNNNIIVASVSDMGRTNIFEFDILRNSKRQLTNNNSINTSPFYANNNRNIIFSSDILGKSNSQIFMIDKNNPGNMKRLSHGDGKYFNPVFSPNNEYIAFTKLLNGNFYIGIMRSDGSNERILAGGYMLESPCWSPNGRVVMFSNTDRNGNSSLYIVDINGKFHKKIKKPDGFNNRISMTDPIWINS